MTQPPSRAEPRQRRIGPSVLICVPRGAGTQPLAQRLRALLEPHIDNVQISADPETVATPDLLLLVNGWGALEPLAALGECKSKFAAPIVVVLNRRHGPLIVELLRAGAADCIRWPVPEAELLARVEMRLTRAPRDVRLDAASLTFTCHDVHARLTLSEFRIVHYLLQNTARWSTTEEMTRAALRSGYASKGVLRVRIYSIRRKLKHESWRLLSNRKFGYRFDISSSHRTPTNDDLRSAE